MSIMRVGPIFPIVLGCLWLQAAAPLPSSATEPPPPAALDLLNPAHLLVQSNMALASGVVDGVEVGATSIDGGSAVEVSASCPGGFVAIPAGTFVMGSQRVEWGRMDDEGLHSVRLRRGFCMQVTEVTQASWSQVMGTSPSHFSGCGVDCPVERVSWYDALAYANARSRLEGLEECYSLRSCRGRPGSGAVTGENAPVVGAGDYVCESVGFVGLECPGYRLPTESEWEYAARAGTTTSTYGGTVEYLSDGCQRDRGLTAIARMCATSASALANGADPSSNGGSVNSGPGAVARLIPNAWGLYDMLGNVWEWVWDGYGWYPIDEVTDPLGDESSATRVFRGGGWGNSARVVRAAQRDAEPPHFRYFNVGFRLARSLPAIPAEEAAPVSDEVSAHISLLGTWEVDADATLAGMPENVREMAAVPLRSSQMQLRLSADGTMSLRSTMMGEERSSEGAYVVVSTVANVVTFVTSAEVNGEVQAETMIATFLDANVIAVGGAHNQPVFIFRRRISSSDPR